MRSIFTFIIAVFILTACSQTSITSTPLPESTPTLNSTSTLQPTETNTPQPTATETNTPVPMSSLEQSVIGLLDEMKVPYTKTNENGVLTLVNNETGKDILRDGRVEISYAVELAKKDCKPTDIEPSTDGFFILYQSWDSFKTYISEIMEDLNFPPDVEGWGLSILIDREKQCWALANSSNIYYRDETGLAKAVPIIHLTEDEMLEFIDGMVNKQLVSP